ncbi:MAG: helix-turn-helix domain-containing protein [Nocardioidaceae bacterium]|nr:helix-turn-helix domain-containing protein [Nocardioidaceae bacterium]
MELMGVSQRAQTLGDFLLEQRRGAQLTLRQLADRAGVSNPYLSQIERGLRKPSADVLQQLAKALRISAETLYVRAGILDADKAGERDVQFAILADPTLTERQRQVLLDIYNSFSRDSHGAPPPKPTSTGSDNATASDSATDLDTASDLDTAADSDSAPHADSATDLDTATDPHPATQRA